MNVSSPKNNATVNAPTVTIAYIESRKTDVARRVYILNGGPETEIPNPTVVVRGSDSYSVTFTLTGLSEGANEIIVRDYDPAGRSAGDAVTVQYEPPAVVLDNDLTVGGVTAFHAGEHIALTRISGGHVANADLCPDRHLHAQAVDGITIDNTGPFPDPNPGACGFGSVVGE